MFHISSTILIKIIIYFILLKKINLTYLDTCRQTLDDMYVKQISWNYLVECLNLVNGEDMPKNVSENMWRLTKLAFESITFIPPDVYKYLGNSLTSIPNDDLHNISFESFETVEAFGLIRSRKNKQDGFNEEQLKILAKKMRIEWLGKKPETYSEYDLKAMGELLCYLNVSDIEQIHPIAFKEAVEWIGIIEICPQDGLKALAKLAKQPDAFGEPELWSTLEVTIVGNILNGLKTNEIESIDEHKRQLNHFYNKNLQQYRQHHHHYSNSENDQKHKNIKNISYNIQKN